MDTSTGTCSGLSPTLSWNAPTSVRPPGTANGRSGIAIGAMLTAVLAIKSPGGTVTIDPSEPTTMPPSAPMAAGPIIGDLTLTGIILSAGPLITVIVAMPEDCAVTMPLGLT